jgi:hypothetical protein
MVYVTNDSAHEWSAKGGPNRVMVAQPFVVAQIITARSTLLNQAECH